MLPPLRPLARVLFPRTARALLAIAAVAAGTAACGGGTPEDGGSGSDRPGSGRLGSGRGGLKNVVLVTIDTTRADRLGCYGYEGARTPVLDGLAAAGVRCSRTHAQTPTTLPSHSSILTGTYSPFHGARGNAVYTVDQENVTLAETLRDRGYATAAVVAAFVLDARYGLDQGFDIYDDDTSEMERVREFVDPSRTAPEVNRAAIRAVDALDPDSPYFLWVHYFDPHAPYLPAPEFQRGFDTGLEGRYDAEIATVDHYLGLLLDELETRGRMRDTLLVVTADHGEGFPGPHDEMTHGIFLYSDTLHVPLLFHAPGHVNEGLVVDELTRQIDIAPTVLDLLGIDDGRRDFQGRSLAGAIALATPGAAAPQSATDATAGTNGDAPDERNEAGTISYAETMLPWDSQGWSPLYSVRDRDWKLVLAPDPELYHLVSDPDEQQNLFRDDHEQVRRLLPELERLRDRTNPRVTSTGGQPMSAKELDRLRALGYLFPSGEEPETLPVELDGLKDPKDYVDLQVQLEYARKHLNDGQRDEALRLLREVVRRDPESLEANTQLASIYRSDEEWDRALEATDVVLRVRPRWGTIRGARGEIHLARADRLLAAGEKDAAKDAYRDAMNEFLEAAELNAHEPAHPSRAGTIAWKRLDDFERAGQLLDRALSIDPDAPRTNLLAGEFLLRTRRAGASIPLLQRALEGDLTDQARASAMTFLANAYSATGDYARSIEVLEKAIAEFPDERRAPLWRQVRDQLAEKK